MTSDPEQPWIGVDFDHTLAVYEGTLYEAGPPVPAMVERVKQWHAEGKRIKIVTARVALGATGRDGFGGNPSFVAEQMKLIRWWCLKHLGFELEITCQKDFKMYLLYDDCARQVERDTGRIIGE